jgi:hypothetical protein
MERGNFQGYVASLETIMANTHFDLRDAMGQFQELCVMITPEKDVPMEIITDIRQTYKQIQDQLTKIRGIKQILEGKYRRYYRRDAQREREIMEFAFLARSLYSKLEYTLQEIEVKRRLRDRGEHFEPWPQPIAFPWFQSKGNQIVLEKNLRSLCALDYNTPPDLEYEQRRAVIRNGMRSISLFTLSGDVPLIDHLQSRMRLREYDILERYREEEFRGALTHLKEVPHSEMERVMRRHMGGSEFLRLKCLVLRIRSQKDLEKEIIASTDNVLRVMGMGEVKTLSIC